MPPKTERSPQRYISPLKDISPDKTGQTKIETYKGKVYNIISEIEGGINLIESGSITPEDSSSLFGLTYVLMKMTLNEKVDVDRSKKGHTEEAIAAVRLSVRLAIACDLHDPQARQIFDDYVKVVEGTELSAMLNKNVDETPDRAVMPETSGEMDEAIAKEIVEKTKGKDIVMIALGHRGIKRAIDIYLDTNLGNSRFWPVRYSPSNYYDRYPNVSWQEIEKIRKWLEEGEGRELVIVGTADRMDNKVLELFKAALPAAKGKTVEEREKSKKEIIPIKLPLLTPEEQNGNGNHNGKKLMEKRRMFQKIKDQESKFS